MKADFVLSESEVSIAVNQIMNHAEFLSQSIDTYIKILSQVQSEGIKDKLICSQLSNLATSVKEKQAGIAQVYENLANYINTEFNDVEDGDNFVFPFDFMTEVTSLLSRFF